MRNLKAMWNRMAREERQRYAEMAKRDRERFELQYKRHQVCLQQGVPCQCYKSEDHDDLRNQFKEEFVARNDLSQTPSF